MELGSSAQIVHVDGSGLVVLSRQVASSHIISTERLYDVAFALAWGFLDLKRNVFSGFLPLAFFCEQRRGRCDCYHITYAGVLIQPDLRYKRLLYCLWVPQMQRQNFKGSICSHLTDHTISYDV